jgi:hypothetical protein
VVRIQRHILQQKKLHHRRVDIILGSRCKFTARKTDEELCVRVGTAQDHINPRNEVEVSVHSRATICVIELDPEEIEYRVGDGIAELRIRNTALRRGGDIEGFIGVLFEIRSKTVDHRSPSYASLVFRSFLQGEGKQTYR